MYIYFNFNIYIYINNLNNLKYLGEVVGNTLTEIIKTVALTITAESNPVSKLKSIFLRTTCAKRDRGLGEVTRSLLGNPLYHSTFKYENLSLDINYRPLAEMNDKDDESAPAVKKTLLDFYGERNLNPHLLQILEEKKIISLIVFAKHFHIIKQNLVPRKNSDNIIIITTPPVTYNNQDIKKHAKYCYYQYIKYGPWDAISIKDLNLNNSIDTWNSFITTASAEIRESVE